MPNQLQTRRGAIALPAYIPVVVTETEDDRRKLNWLIVPYLKRLKCVALMSYYYAQRLKDSPNQRPDTILAIDSGGYATKFDFARVEERNGLGVIICDRPEGEEIISPKAVLELQEAHAEIGFTLDFLLPLKLTQAEMIDRQRLAIANARWAASNKRRKDLVLFGSIPCWDLGALKECAQEIASIEGLQGIALGSLIPRLGDEGWILKAVETVRETVPSDYLIHVFGLGQPGMAVELFRAGSTSLDSSAYAYAALEGRDWTSDTQRPDPSAIEMLNIALRNLSKGLAIAGNPAGLPMATLPQFATFHLP